MSLTVLQPTGWPRPKGYANGVMGTGTFVLVSGQIGLWTARAFSPTVWWRRRGRRC